MKAILYGGGRDGCASSLNRWMGRLMGWSLTALVLLAILSEVLQVAMACPPPSTPPSPVLGSCTGGASGGLGPGGPGPGPGDESDGDDVIAWTSAARGGPSARNRVTFAGGAPGGDGDSCTPPTSPPVCNSPASRPLIVGDPIYLRYGTVTEDVVDLVVKGPVFPWTQSRTYDTQVSGTTHLGGKWLSNNGDLRLVMEGVGGDLALLVNASSKRVFTYSGGTYTAPADSTLLLVYDGTTGEFVLTDWSSGRVYLFYNFINAHGGFLKQETTVAWRHAGKEGVLYTYNAEEQLTQITTPDGQDYNIVFTYTGGNVTKIEVRTGADTSTRIKQVEYTYFNSGVHSADLGGANDLVQVKVSRLKSGGSPGTATDWIARYTQYRYGSNGLLKAVFEADEVARLVAERSDISTADAILTKGDTDDDSGSEEYTIQEYASSRFTYYTTDVKTCNTGAGTPSDPKCLTVWSPTSGEDLNSKYGGANISEVPTGAPMIKSGTIGGCSRCGDVQGVTFQYFYMAIDHATPDDHEVIRLVVEDTVDADGNGVYRTVYGLNDSGRMLREVKIADPVSAPQFWCKSWKLSSYSDARRWRVEEYRTPAAHNVTTSTVDEFLNPSNDGNFTNDTNTLNASTGAIHVYEHNTEGDRSGARIKQGRTGTANYVSATDYYGGAVAMRKHLVTYQHAYHTATITRDDNASRTTVGYSYAFWTGTDNIQTVTTTLPAVSADQNGSGTSATMVDYLDSVGGLRWQKDPLGYVTYYSYHPGFGALAYVVRDCDPTSLPSSADSNDTKWVTSGDGSASSNKPTRGGGLPTPIEQVALRQFDSQGRTELAATEDGATGTVLARHYAVFEVNRTLQFPYWDTSTNKPLLPIQAKVTDDGGTLAETYTIDPGCTSASGGKPIGLAAGTDQTDYLSWTRLGYGVVIGDRSSVHVYHNVPSSGYGSKDTNYAETRLGYDSVRRQDRDVSPGGTITRTVFDSIGRQSSAWVGTDDVPSSGTWSPTNNSGANMVKLAEYQYDGGSAGGNSNRTKLINYLTDAVEANARVTLLKYDWRDRLVFTVDPEQYDGKATYSRVELDNLGHATKTERYYDADDDQNFPIDGTVDGGDRLLARTETLLDNLGRVYRTKTYAVTPSDGTVGSYLVANTWYDAAGQAIKQQSGNTFTKTSYDALGRPTKRYTGYDTDEDAWSEVVDQYGLTDVTGDTILRQSEVAYDASGNVIQSTRYARKHTTSDTGALSTSNARVTYAAAWYDGAGRQTASADYGTNGGSAFSRPSSAPSSSDTVLVTTTEYNTAGLAYKTIDPAAKEARQEFDHADRVTKTIQNYTDGNPSTGTADQDVTVEMAYNSDDALLTLTAKNPTTGDQITKYVYGTDLGGITPYAYRNDVLRSEIYPDSDDTTSLGNGTDGVYDRMELQYNIQGNLLNRKDQIGTIHEYVLDKAGRQLHDRITTVGTGVDNAVLRISQTYDIRGLIEKVTSYDNATVGSGSVVNEVVFEHDDLDNLAKEYQEHSGAKDANTLYVQYNRDTTAASSIFTKGLRPTSVRYPNGRLVHTTYGTSGEMNDVVNRPAAINDDNSGSPGNAVAEYTYLGGSTIVRESYPQADVRLDYDSGTEGEYAGFDRFGRVVDHLWRDYGRSVDAVRIKHGYDRASNRVYREDPVAIAASANLEELYSYDGVNQLTHRDRGALNANKDAVTSKDFAEDWTLDMTGNWPTFKQDTDGNGTWDLDQSRTHDKANEITEIAGSNTNVAEDLAGNMTKLPKPSNWSAHFDLTYDAWNRLIKVMDGETTVATYAYDGRNFRTTKTTSGSTRHYYYSQAWQVLEERVGDSASAERQNIWGLRYIDDLVLRDRDADANTGTGNLGSTGSGLEERLYGLQDPNWNAVAVAGTDGAIQERFSYSAYGQPLSLSGTFGSQPAASYAWDTFYTGRQLDAETGIYYYRNRYYSAEVGRFLSGDPISYRGGMNLYRYVGNRPTMGVDPQGLACCIPAAGAIGGAGGVIGSQCIQGCTPRYPDNPGSNDNYRDECGKCTISVELVCREMPADWTGMFYHCFLAVKDANGNYVQAVSGIRDDTPGSPTEGSTISAIAAGVPGWDILAIQSNPYITAPFNLPPGQDACQFLECAQNYAANVSGNFKYNQYYDNSNTFITRVIRHCNGTADFPYWAFGSDDIYPPEHYPVGPGTPCFVEGTQIHTEAGLRNIETISPGEKVWSYNRQQESWVLMRVSDTETNEHSGAIVAIKAGADTIKATPKHPFWVTSGESLETRPPVKAQSDVVQQPSVDGRWVAAQDIRSGDRLFARDGRPIVVDATETVEATVRVFNLVVERLRNYATGDTGMLVGSM